MKLFVCFYYGVTLPALIERAVCRRAGQRLSDVPSHVALVVHNPGGWAEAAPPDGSDVWTDTGESFLLYEFVSTGFRVRQPSRADFGGSVGIEVPDHDALRDAVASCYGQKYSWGEVIVAGLNRLLPKGHKLYYRSVRGEDCSCAVQAWLAAGGVDIDCGGDPSPNDIKFGLTSLAAEMAGAMATGAKG